MTDRQIHPGQHLQDPQMPAAPTSWQGGVLVAAPWTAGTCWYFRTIHLETCQQCGLEVNPDEPGTETDSLSGCRSLPDTSALFIKKTRLGMPWKSFRTLLPETHCDFFSTHFYRHCSPSVLFFISLV